MLLLFGHVPEICDLYSQQELKEMKHAVRFLSVLLACCLLGPLYVLALLPLLWKQIKLTLFFALCELTGGATLQILKHLISMPRPASAFEDHPGLILPLVEGIDLHSSNSFPSGHASTFFIFCTCAALYLAYRYQQRVRQNCKTRACLLFDTSLLLLMIFAALGAYSRVYLSQHFLCDVCMGSIIGFVTPCLMFFFGKEKILRLKPDAPEKQ